MIVIDTSALVDALVADPTSQALRDRITGEDLHAPHLVDHEVVPAVRGMTLGGHLSTARAEDLLTDLEDLRIERWPALDELRRRAFELRHDVTAYDAAYVALAETLGCPLVTRDAPLSRSSGHRARIELW